MHCIGRRLAIALTGLITAQLACLCPAATYHLSPHGQDDASGSTDSPWRTLQHGVDQLKPGDTLRVGEGIYRQSLTISRGGTKANPVSIVAERGAKPVITGADVLSDQWREADEVTGDDQGTSGEAANTKTNASKASNEIYVHPWPHVFRWNTWAADDPPQLTHPDDDYHRLIGRAEQVIYRGRLLRQVLKPAQLARGTFLADTKAHKLYVHLPDGANLADGDASVQASVRPFVLKARPGVSHVRLRGLTLRYAANHAQRGMVALGFANSRGQRAKPCVDWTISDCRFEWANGAGAKFTGHGHKFIRCTFADNGQLGFGATQCHDSTMSRSTIERNNRKGYSTAWEAGGTKIVLSRGFDFDHCLIADNRGPGIWYDIGNRESTVSDCTFKNNDQSGLFYEISFGLHAHDNVFINNGNGHGEPGEWGVGGIRLFSSHDCVIEHNTLVNNREGIALVEQNRKTPTLDPNNQPLPARPIHTSNYMIRDNLIAWSRDYNIALWWDRRYFGPHPSGSDKNEPAKGDPRQAQLKFINNALCPLPRTVNILYGPTWRKKHRTFKSPAAFHQATTIPANGRVIDRPGFVDPQAGNYHRKSNAPAPDAGKRR